MRLWHKDLIVNGLLPKGQLLAQWRELNSIFAKQDNHILINYVYDYHKDHLLYYSLSVIGNMLDRGYRINKWDNFDEYFQMNGDAIVKRRTADALKKYAFQKVFKENVFYNEHNYFYLLVCYYNLAEKFIRGQKDYTPELFEKLQRFMIERGLL